MSRFQLRTGFESDVDSVSLATGLVCDPAEGMTQQQFAEDADINVIVKRFGLTGELPATYRAPMTGDFTGISDFHSAMNAVREAEERFLQVPAEVRARFDHDPQKLMEFLDDAGNREEAIKLGLIPMPPERVREPLAPLSGDVVQSAPPQGAA